MKKNTILLLLIFIIINGPAHTQFENATPSARALLSTLTNEDPTAGQHLARQLWNYCSELVRIIPRNSPREEDWLQAELNSGDINRATRAIASVEYTRWNFVTTFVSCADYSSKLTASPSSRGAAPAALWARLAMTFNDAEGLKESASRIGLLQLGNEKSDIHLIQFLAPLRLRLIVAVLYALGEKP